MDSGGWSGFNMTLWEIAERNKMRDRIVELEEKLREAEDTIMYLVAELETEDI